MRSTKPGKQKKEMYNSPLHKKRKWISAHLEENLLLKYDKRAISVIKGDTIKVMRGSFRGHEDKVVRVNVKKWNVEIEGITMSKADGNKIAKPIHPSNVMITKLNLTDKWRRKKLERGLSEETKKEIEKEAAEQIKEAEEELKRKEEEKIEEEGEIIEEDIKETIEQPEKEEKTEEKRKQKPKEKKVEKIIAPKKEPKKKETTKPIAKKKPLEKKESLAKKKSVKKTNSKKSKTKREKNE
jgi:large subunit ribosomal protein L24